jgi:hypothetical protein
MALLVYEELPMSPMISAREQEKNKYLMNVMMNSKQLIHVTIEGSE